MEHFFELPVMFDGEEKIFNGRLVTFGYSYKFYITIDRKELVFEKDDEQQYRVISEAGDAKYSPSLLEAIVTTLNKL